MERVGIIGFFIYSLFLFCSAQCSCVSNLLLRNEGDDVCCHLLNLLLDCPPARVTRAFHCKLLLLLSIPPNLFQNTDQLIALIALHFLFLGPVRFHNARIFLYRYCTLFRPTVSFESFFYYFI